MKKFFVVYRKEVWVQGVLVQADSKEQAVAKVDEGEGESIPNTLEYHSTLTNQENPYKVENYNPDTLPYGN